VSDLWTAGWRERSWSDLDRPWDLIVIGGGITGAGILREAGRLGWRGLLVEARDFASGTSSRSSKLVHGGLRYLASMQLRLTAESVHERQRLLRERRGLVEPLENILASYAGDRPPKWMMGAALALYDLLALEWRHQYHPAAEIEKMCPSINPEGMTGGYGYWDAQTDDARLVLRVLGEAVRAGGTALSYAPVEGLLRDSSGRVHGVQLRDQVSGREKEVRSPVVINASGAWADHLRSHVDATPRLRRLRGSHFFFPWNKLPLTQAITFMHPSDRRPVFAYRWEGVTILGTTDVDQQGDVPADPHLSPREIDYLMEAARHAFKPLNLGLGDVQSAISGVRAVVNTNQADPSKESREFVLWDEHGLLTVTSGKLTTFRLMARRALHAVRRRLPDHSAAKPGQPELGRSDCGRLTDLGPALSARLLGRYGDAASELARSAQPGELEPIGDTPSLWAELRWAARSEGVVHLEDLLLRRVRLGLISPYGGLPLVDRIRSIVQPELGWDDTRWDAEVSAYSHLWTQSYSAGQ
jgi:glycerol-3-phosphate dehydrogenase